MSVCEGCSFDYLWKDEVTTCPKECEGCVYIDGKPSKYKPMQKTNADRIRAMTDEELAEFLANEVPHDCAYCNLLCATFDGDKFAGSCQNAFYRWLSEPAEGD